MSHYKYRRQRILRVISADIDRLFCFTTLFRSISRYAIFSIGYWLLVSLKTIRHQTADCRPNRELPLDICSSTVIPGEVRSRVDHDIGVMNIKRDYIMVIYACR